MKHSPSGVFMERFSRQDSFLTIHSFDAWPPRFWGDETVRKAAAILLLAFALLARAAWPQSGPEKSGNEVQVWTGGGHGLSGSTSDTGVWNVGVRYGWVLTNPHGPGFLRGRFEYAVDVVPIFPVFQPTGAA